MNRRLDLGITVPQHIIVSGYHELSDAWAVMGDFGWENWSQFGKVDVAVVGPTTTSLTTAIDYNDTYHVGIGTQYRLNPEWPLNSGFAYDSSMTSAANVGVALPVGATYKFGMGANWLMNQNVKLGFSYELAYSGDISISQNRGPLAGQVTGQFQNAHGALLRLHSELGISRGDLRSRRLGLVAATGYRSISKPLPAERANAKRRLIRNERRNKMKLRLAWIITIVAAAAVAPAIVLSQESLPFPPTPSASIAGRTIQESVYKPREAPRRLPADAPNILIVLLDDTGPGLPSTYGGEIHTPALDRVAKAGVSYNRFHSTAMCSPTRAALLTGRNHHRVGNGQIAEFANDWDGYPAQSPKVVRQLPKS